MTAPAGLGAPVAHSEVPCGPTQAGLHAMRVGRRVEGARVQDTISCCVLWTAIRLLSCGLPEVRGFRGCAGLAPSPTDVPGSRAQPQSASWAAPARLVAWLAPEHVPPGCPMAKGTHPGDPPFLLLTGRWGGAR
jgi:hypothetical protein